MAGYKAYKYIQYYRGGYNNLMMPARIIRTNEIMKQPFFTHFSWGVVANRRTVYPIALPGSGDLTVIMPKCLVDISIIGGFGTVLPSGNNLTVKLSDCTTTDYKSMFFKSYPDLMRILEIALRRENNKEYGWSFSKSCYSKMAFHIVLLLNNNIDTSYFNGKEEYANYKFVTSNAELFKTLLELNNSVPKQIERFSEDEAKRIMNVLTEHCVHGLGNIDYYKKYQCNAYINVNGTSYQI